MSRGMLVLLLFALSSCDSEDAEREGPAPVTLAGSLDLELRSKAELSLIITGERLSAELELESGFDVAPSGESLRGDGRVEAFAEAGLTLYTAHISLPAQSAGRCGENPVSLALSLHRRGDNAYVAGSLTAYCGADVFHGLPARAPLRLTGSLPLAAP